MRSVVAAGIDLIKHFEGLKLKAYPDPATHGAPWTVGYGSTGPGIKPDTVWTQEQADARLAEDVARTAARVEALLKAPVTDNQFAALVCFAYNVGVGNLSTSTLLICLNNKHPEKAIADEFLKWNKAAGKIMAGLTARREAERALFLS